MSDPFLSSFGLRIFLASVHLWYYFPGFPGIRSSVCPGYQESVRFDDLSDARDGVSIWEILDFLCLWFSKFCHPTSRLLALLRSCHFLEFELAIECRVIQFVFVCFRRADVGGCRCYCCCRCCSCRMPVWTVRVGVVLILPFRRKTFRQMTFRRLASRQIH